MSFRYYAMGGSQIVWEQGDREIKPQELDAELSALGLKQDLVVWRRVAGQSDSLAATLEYSPRGYRVRLIGYVNWPSIEAMTEDEAAEMYQGLNDVFTGRKVT
ncbi:MAG: hypothetical protein WCO91_00480 [Gemmataceae bacterium]